MLIYIWISPYPTPITYPVKSWIPLHKQIQPRWTQQQLSYLPSVNYMINGRCGHIYPTIQIGRLKVIFVC